jgi:hypothetical protein
VETATQHRSIYQEFLRHQRRHAATRSVQEQAVRHAGRLPSPSQDELAAAATFADVAAAALLADAVCGPFDLAPWIREGLNVARAIMQRQWNVDAFDD